MASRVRQNIHTASGRSIPAEPGRYAAYMRRLVGDVPPFTGRLPDRRVTGLVTPHIDHARGRDSYREAFALLQTVPKPDLVIALGTCHLAHESLIHLTHDSYRTPRAVMPTPADSVDRLVAACGEHLLAYEARHGAEWSIELGSYFLEHCWHEQGPVQMLPILVSPFEFYCATSPTELPKVEAFITALAREVFELERSGKRVLLWAPVDLSHRGTYFDASDPTCVGLEQPTRSVDRGFLNRLVEMQSQAAFSILHSVGNPTRIDAMSPTYVLLEVLARTGLAKTGHLLGYHQSVDYPDGCMVTHASAYWH